MSNLGINLSNSAIVTALNNKLDMDSLASRIDKTTMRINDGMKLDVKEASLTVAGVVKSTNYIVADTITGYGSTVGPR